MTLNFYVSYLVPVSPERIAEVEKQIAHVIATVDPPDEAERQVARLQLQMEPERRREPAIMRSHVGPDGRVWNWDCPRCGSVEGLTHVVAAVRSNERGSEVTMRASCPECGAEVHKEELPMPLDLYRMRTRRTDGVEVQPKQQWCHGQ